MTDDFDTCAMCGEPLDDHENPEDCPVQGEDADERTTAELRDDVTGDIASAHAFVGVYLRFPREANDLDEMNMATAEFMFQDDMSLTEYVAARKILSVGLERLVERHDADDPSGGPDVQAMAVPAGGLGHLVGGGGGGGEQAEGTTDADRRGFQ